MPAGSCGKQSKAINKSVKCAASALFESKKTRHFSTIASAHCCALYSFLNSNKYLEKYGQITFSAVYRCNTHEC